MPETKQAVCKRKDCGEPVRSAETWPGDLGWCSAICMSLDEIEAAAETTRRRMNDVASLLGYRSAP